MDGRERDQPESPWLLVYTDADDLEIAKVHARTDEKKKFSYPGGKPMYWAFDRSGELRAITPGQFGVLARRLDSQQLVSAGGRRAVAKARGIRHRR